MNQFVLVLGEENQILPGKQWESYLVDVLEDRMVCTLKKDQTVKREILYSNFTKAEFGMGNGNLWLQCVVQEKRFVFCSPRKSWKSEAGKLLIEKIESATKGIIDYKSYKQYTRPFFLFFAMFK